MNIGFDLDGILSNFHYSFSLVGNRLFGLPIIEDIEEVKDWEWEDWYPMTKNQKIAIWKEIDTNTDLFWFNMCPLYNNFQRLRKLEEVGHNLFFVTSRKNTAGLSALRQTKLWLEKQGLKDFSVIPAHKKGMVLDRAEIKYFIDDMPENIIEASIEATKCRSFLLARRYNSYAIEFLQKSHKYRKNIGIVYSIDEFLDQIK